MRFLGWGWAPLSPFWRLSRRDFKKSQTFCASRNHLCLHTLWKLFVQLLKYCVTLHDPIDCSTPGFPVLHQPSEFAQTCAYWVGNAIQPFHPLSPSSPPALNLSQYQSLFQWALRMRWPSYWSFSISPSNEYSGLISFRIDWFDLLAVQGTLKSLVEFSYSHIEILWCWTCPVTRGMQ